MKLFLPTTRNEDEGAVEKGRPYFEAFDSDSILAVQLRQKDRYENSVHEVWITFREDDESGTVSTLKLDSKYTQSKKYHVFTLLMRWAGKEMERYSFARREEKGKFQEKGACSFVRIEEVDSYEHTSTREYGSEAMDNRQIWIMRIGSVVVGATEDASVAATPEKVNGLLRKLVEATS